MSVPKGDERRVYIPGLGIGPFSYPKSFQITSFDPGGTTGMARATYLHGHPFIKFESWELDPEKLEHHDLLFGEMSYIWRGTSEATVVCESFEFRQMGEDTKKKVELISREYIGIIKLWTKMNNVQLHMQTASTGKSLIPDKGPQQDVKLKQLGLWTPGHPHAMDAYRHLFRYMVVSDRAFKNFLAQKWMET